MQELECKNTNIQQLLDQAEKRLVRTEDELEEMRNQYAALDSAHFEVKNKYNFMKEEYKLLQERCEVYEEEYMKKVVEHNSQSLNQQMVNQALNIVRGVENGRRGTTGSVRDSAVFR